MLDIKDISKFEMTKLKNIFFIRIKTIFSFYKD